MQTFFITLGGLIGIIIGGIIQMLIARYIHLSNERMAFRKLAIEAGLDNWRHNNALKIDAVKLGAKGIKMEEPDSYVIHMLKLIDKASDMSMSEAQAADKIKNNAI